MMKDHIFGGPPVRSIHFNLILLVMLFISVSCGGSKSTKANIVVSHGFSISNSGYEGGLSFYGRSSEGESFAYSSLPNSTQNQIVLDLKKGTWTIGVVGWSGAGAGNNLKGTPYCGTTTVNLSSNEQKVTLSASAANCLSSVFANSANVTVGTTPTLKSLLITLCPKISAATTASPPTFCKDLALDESLGDDIWSIQLQLPSKPIPGDASSPAPVKSVCISTENFGTFDLSNSSIKIPTKNFPINIIAYTDKGCQNQSNFYIFDKGIEASYEFDKNLILPTTAGTIPRLFLVSSRSKNEASPLASLTPAILCSGNQCGFTRALPSGVDYLIRSYGPDFSEIVLAESGSCGNFNNFDNFTETPDAGDIEFANPTACFVNNKGKVILKVKPSTATSCISASTPCKISYSDADNNTHYKYLAVNVMTLGDQLRYQEIIAQTLGFDNRDGLSTLLNSMPHIDRAIKTNGILHDVREMFSGNGIGGAFKTFATCSDMTGDKYLDVFEEGSFKSVKISVTSINEDAPVQIRSTLTSPYDTFDKKITISFPGPNLTFVPAQVMKIDCDKKIGMAEDYRNEDGRLERSLIYWNTDPSLDLRRVQEYRFEQTASQVRTSYTEVEKASLGPGGMLVKKMEYEASKSGSNYSGNLRRYEIFVENATNGFTTANFKELSHTSITADNEHIFNTPQFQFVLQPSSIHQLDATSNTVVHAQSHNGQYRAIVELEGTSGVLKVQTSTHLFSQTFSVPSMPGKFTVAMNDSGAGMIATARGDGVIQLVPFNVNASTLTISSVLTNNDFTAYTDGEPRLYYGNDNYITLAVRHSDQKVRLTIIKPDGTKSTGYTSTSLGVITGYANQFAVSHNPNAANDGTAATVCYNTGYFIYCDFVTFSSATPVALQYSQTLSGANSYLYPGMKYNGSGWDINVVDSSGGGKFYNMQFSGNTLTTGTVLQTNYGSNGADSYSSKQSDMSVAATNPATIYDFDSLNFPIKRAFDGTPQTLKPSTFVNVFSSNIDQ